MNNTQSSIKFLKYISVYTRKLLNKKFSTVLIDSRNYLLTYYAVHKVAQISYMHHVDAVSTIWRFFMSHGNPANFAYLLTNCLFTIIFLLKWYILFLFYIISISYSILYSILYLFYINIILFCTKKNVVLFSQKKWSNFPAVGGNCRILFFKYIKRFLKRVLWYVLYLIKQRSFLEVLENIS